jgi:hypothetical protein
VVAQAGAHDLGAGRAEAQVVHGAGERDRPVGGDRGAALVLGQARVGFRRGRGRGGEQDQPEGAEGGTSYDGSIGRMP